MTRLARPRGSDGVPATRRARRTPGRALALGAAAILMASAAEARITRIVIDPAKSQSPTFEGRVFGPDGSVGTYEKLRGKAYGELDPADPRNALITDLKLAPRNARGKVEYSMDIFILKPSDVRKGNHKLFLDFNNRGEMRVLALNDAALSNNPVKAAEAGTGFIMNLGYSVVGNGWDFGATNDDDGLTISVPVAKNPDGLSITGPSYEYIVFDNAKSVRYDLAYPAATLDKSKATLTVRPRLDDQPTTLAAGDWEYVDEKAIRLLPAGTAFKQSHIYEFRYTAKDPVVAAVGLAATRDLVSFLRHAAKDDAGTPNPLAGDVRYAYSFSISQPSRTLNDFEAFGFNEDEQGRRVLDGMLKWTGAGSGDQINYRFGQTDRTERNRQNHLYPEPVFPFAHQVLTDHLSGKTGGRGARCAVEQHVPQDHRRQFGQRVLGQVGIAAAHRHARQGLEGSGERALLPDLGPVTRRRERQEHGIVPAVPQPHASLPRAACVVHGARPVGHPGHRAPEKRSAAAVRGHGGPGRAQARLSNRRRTAGEAGVADHPRRDVYRTDHGSISSGLRPEAR